MAEKKDDRPTRAYIKHRARLNDKLVRFRLKTDSNHVRRLHCYQVDDCGESWAVHYRIAVPGMGYTRTFTEWFEKLKWDFVPKGQVVRPGIRTGETHNFGFRKRLNEAQAAKAPKDENVVEETPAPAPVVPEPIVEAKTALQAAMERIEALERAQKPESVPVKSPPPRILLAEDDETPSEEEDEAEIVHIDPKTNLKIVGKAVDLTEQTKGGKPIEYNRHAHKEMFWGKPEDLAMFDAQVTANATLAQGRAKAAMMRHKRELIAKAQDGPLGSGASFTPDGTDF
jgi:hypothetical protein